MAAAFDGLHVLDLSNRLSGAFAARLFGDFGADVLLAESPAGHPLRAQGPFLDDRPGPDRGFLNAFANWNKRATTVWSPDDLAALTGTADVVITNLSPGGDGDLGGVPIRPALSRLKPGAVHLALTPHGPSGPLAAAPGTHLTACARTGWAQVNRYQGEPPLQLPRDQTGYVGGLAGFLAAAAALLGPPHASAREVSVSEAEALALTVHPWGIAAIYNGQGFSNAAGGRPRGAPHPLWDLADGRMHFAISDFHNWTEALDALGLPELARREALIPDLGRHSQDLTEVAVAMVDSLKPLRRWAVFERLAGLRCPVGVVQTLDELLENPHLLARDFLVETEVDGRRLRAPGAPAKHSSSPWALRRPAPRLDGEKRGWTTPARPAGGQVRAAGRPSPEGPLAGVRVLSFGQAWSGTFGTELLSLLGADVVQVGSRHRPDVWRRVGGTVPKAVARPDRVQHALNTQGLYNSVNLNKRELALDLRDERGRDLFWRLLPRFDVLVDNFRPTVMPGWGVTLERLHELRPGMVWASVSGYGATGPYARFPANGSTTEPMSGLSSIHGYAGDTGMNTGGLFPDPMSGYFLAASVIAALHARDRTGEAQRVDLSMMEAVSVLCGEAVLEGQARGQAPGPGGNRHPLMAPHGYFPARSSEDGEAWVAIAVTDDEAWAALVAETGEARLQDPRFARFEGRKQFEDEIEALLAGWTGGQDASAAEARLLARGVAAARVVPLYELYDRPDPNFLATGFIARVDHREVGQSWLPGRPWRFGSAPAAQLRPAPCVGEHSREILVGELGLTEAEYAGLVAAGVTGGLSEKT